MAHVPALWHLRVFAVALIASTGALAQEVNLYTTREPGLIKPLLDDFAAETGVVVNTVFMKDGLPERVEAEGRNSPADLLMTVDFGNLIDLVDKGVTQPVHSAALTSAIPENLRDKDGHWFALSMRARVLYASKERVSDAELSYEDLADPKWRNRICIRSGQHPYNTALFAAHLVRHGPEQTEAWLAAIRDNTARKPGGGDRDVARDILGGICDIGPANSYYVGLMRSGAGGPDQKAWGEAIRVILPTFRDGGTHVNVSGAAMAINAPNRDNALRLLEYLVTDRAQQVYARANFEYPVKPGVAPDPIIDALGALMPDQTSLVAIAEQRRAASELVDIIGFNN